MSMKKSNDLIIGCLCALGCETLYGLSFIFTKHVTMTTSPFALLGWRFLLAVIVMSICITAGLMKVDLKNKPLKPLLLISFLTPCVYFVGEVIGISHTTASETGVFLAFIPVASLIASTLILKKKPTGVQVAGILVALAGVLATVFAVGASSSFSVTGYTFLSIAMISYALYCVYVEKASDYSGAEITYAMAVVGAMFFITVALAEALCAGKTSELLSLPFRSRGFLSAVLYQGIGCSVIAFFLSNIAIAKIGVNRTASFIGVATVVAVLSGALVLKERFTLWQTVGTAVIIAGVYIANINVKNSAKTDNN